MEENKEENAEERTQEKVHDEKRRKKANGWKGSQQQCHVKTNKGRINRRKWR